MFLIKYVINYKRKEDSWTAESRVSSSMFKNFKLWKHTCTILKFLEKKNKKRECLTFQVLYSPNNNLKKRPDDGLDFPQYVEMTKQEEDVAKEELWASEMMGCVSFSHEECFGVGVWLCRSRNARPAGSCLLPLCDAGLCCTASSCQII